MNAKARQPEKAPKSATINEHIGRSSGPCSTTWSPSLFPKSSELLEELERKQPKA